jgi:phosphoribosylcarboxyaminoimidazole (NCAIR) mutase
MAQTFTFELDGARELRNMLEVSGKDAGKVVGQVILEEANMIFAKAMILTPIDTGALRGSGGVSAPMNMPQGIGVDIFFGGPAAPYAMYVHEILGNYHNPPTQAKYLEQPFMERLPEIQQNMARRIIDLIRKNGAV